MTVSDKPILQMLMIGVFGECLWRVLAQTRASPPYIVDETLDGIEGKEQT